MRNHKSKPAPRISAAAASRSPVVAHDGIKSVHTHRSPGRSHPENIAVPAVPRATGSNRNVGNAASGSGTGSDGPPTTGQPNSFFNPPNKPSAGQQAGMYYAQRANMAGRPPLK